MVKTRQRQYGECPELLAIIGKHGLYFIWRTTEWAKAHFFVRLRVGFA